MSTDRIDRIDIIDLIIDTLREHERILDNLIHRLEYIIDSKDIDTIRRYYKQL